MAEAVQAYRDKNGAILKIGDKVKYDGKDGELQNVCGVSMLKVDGKYKVFKKIDFSKIEKIGA